LRSICDLWHEKKMRIWPLDVYKKSLNFENSKMDYNFFYDPRFFKKQVSIFIFARIETVGIWWSAYVKESAHRSYFVSVSLKLLYIQFLVIIMLSKSLSSIIKVCDEEFKIPWIFLESASWKRSSTLFDHPIWLSREISPISDNCHNFDNGRPLNRTKVAANTFSV
jgi:hypothetical protein